MTRYLGTEVLYSKTEEQQTFLSINDLKNSTQHVHSYLAMFFFYYKKVLLITRLKNVKVYLKYDL